MSLPIDIAGSLWFMPTAVWEWENEPAPPQEASGKVASVPTDVSATDAMPAGRLVFKGYRNATQFHWFAAESLVSRPWLHSRLDDAERRRVAAPLRPPAEPPQTDEDSDPAR